LLLPAKLRHIDRGGDVPHRQEALDHPMIDRK